MKKLLINRIERSGMLPQMPVFGSKGAAAFDLSVFTDEDIVIHPGERERVPTGLRVEIPEGMAGLVFIRSGISYDKGLSLTNSVGLIDSDYRGEVMVSVTNDSTMPIALCNGQRIAQFMLVSLPAVEIEEAASLSDTDRGDGGFGSTGEHNQ